VTKKKLTAAELVGRLNANAQFVEAQRRREAERSVAAENLRRAEQPLIRELAAVGVSVASVWELVNTSRDYSAAVPVLLAHLVRAYPPSVREGIARALAIPEARSGWKTLCRLYHGEEEERLRDGLAVALAAACDETVLADIIGMVRDTRLGPSRVLLLAALERSRDPRGRATLQELARDPDLAAEVRATLRRIRGRKHRDP